MALILGELGSRIYANGRVVEVGIFPTEPVDPTGAGDVFSAAFVHGLARGKTVERSAQRAAAAASIVVEDHGPSALERLDDEELARRSAEIDICEGRRIG